ncbi:MAG: hypothetical protein JKY09_04985, partial [Crocinitomicaceae bacterium]|nr:hypothetical protein [Crocinitomicaceae bacterium]
MYKIVLLFFIGIVTTSFFVTDNVGLVHAKFDKIDISEIPIEEVLRNLDNPDMLHSMSTHTEELAKQGEDLILYGLTQHNGKISKRISMHFMCVDCHNLTREFAELPSQSPEDRFDYADKNGLAYLPASTFWGIYNRTSFFNGDYIKKYGDLVINARDTLQNAIQLCAKYCASGRYLDDWEVEAIMHY